MKAGNKSAVKPDHRRILALLPGRLIGRQLIEEELEFLRESIRSGENREYIALLPGLETELEQINHELGSMAEMVGFGSQPHRKTSATSQNNGHHHAGVEPQPKQLTAGAAVDVNEVLGNHRLAKGKPTLPVLAIWEFQQQNNTLHRKTFFKRHKIKNTVQTKATLSMVMKAFRDKGLDISKVQDDTYTLYTPITGTVTGVDTPADKPTTKHIIPAEPLPASPDHSKTPLFEGNRNEVLLAEFEACGGAADMAQLARKYNTTNRYTYNWAMNNLKDKCGYEFENTGSIGVFRITKQGSYTPTRGGE